MNKNSYRSGSGLCIWHFGHHINYETKNYIIKNRLSKREEKKKYND